MNWFEGVYQKNKITVVIVIANSASSIQYVILSTCDSDLTIMN